MATLRKVLPVFWTKQIALPGLRVAPSVCRLSTEQTSSSGGSSGDAAPPVPPASSAPPSTAQPDPTDDNKSYRTQEYYAHNEWSYYDVDNDMAADRLKQPSKFDKPVPKIEAPKA